ncbi:tyrosinase family protein [Streptomyces apocyni]|uniref:tyrosinase family protein n=1 Tax=Streptomyces apocyni TaxID=2654677 RepID=UPI0012E9FB4B|nr:tyrosinase family protein [Streptomyces apocyni]
MAYIRQNQSTLTAAQKKRFVAAVLALKRKGQYDDFVRTHIEFYVSDGDGGLRVAHMTPSFLPWHRKFLLDFEQALQRVDSGVSVPYWDWTADRSPAASLWADDFLGGNGRRSDRQVMTGPFAYQNGNWKITESESEAEYLTRDFGRPHDPMDLPKPEDLAVAMRDPRYDAEPWNSLTETGFRNRLEGWTSGRGNDRWRNHNQVHRWVGGHMLGASSVNDPVFWLNHAFVDLCWSRWYERHGDAAPYLPAEPPRPGQPQFRRIIAAEERMPPWDVRPVDLIEHKQLYRYG